MYMRPSRYLIFTLLALLLSLINGLEAQAAGAQPPAPGDGVVLNQSLFPFSETIDRLKKDIAGKGLANPTALIQSAVLMLAHLGERDASARLQNALEGVYAEGRHLTGDVGGKASTSEFTDAVIRHVAGIRPTVGERRQA